MKRSILIAALLCFLYIGAQAQTALSLDECRAMALQASYALKSSEQRILYSKDMASAYRANYFPDISAKGSYLYSTSSINLTIEGGNLPLFVSGVYDPYSYAYMPDIEMEIDVNSVYNASAVLTQPIYMGGKIRSAHNLSKLGVEISEIDKQREEASVLESLDNAFYCVIELEELLLSAQKYQEVVAELLRQVESAHWAGMTNRNDVMKVSVRLNEAQLLTQKATNGLTLARMNLCYLVGLPMNTKDLVLEVPIMQVGYIYDTSHDITSRPEYAMLEKQIEAKELEVKITRADMLPSVAAVASYGYTNALTMSGNTLINSTAFTGGVSVNIPIFHFGERRRKVSAKEHEANIARNTLEDFSQQMTLEMMQAINEVNEAIMQVSLTQKSVAQAEENMRLSKNGYDVGMETIADLLEAGALWQKAMSDNSSAKRELRGAYTKYLKTIGELN